MAKRTSEADENTRPPKRPKQLDNEPVVLPAEDIRFARQLQQLLVFRQDGIEELRHGIASLKTFLEKILYKSDDDDQEQRLSILREFIDSERPRDIVNTERPFLSQLWQAWSYANQTNNDHLAGSICAVFALLLKTLSALLEFREQGALLCRTLLQHQHLRLVKRCFDAPKHKDFLISPSLRLLLELISFDGGVFARETYKRREQTFDVTALRKNLSVVKVGISAEESHRRPSVRTLTVRYVLAHLKYQNEGGKISILSHRALCTALFSNLRDDPPDLLIELLNSTENFVFKDDELPRSAKSALITQQHLERVTDIATRSASDERVAKASLVWLQRVSSIPSYGVLRSSGWYPPATSRAVDSASFDKDAIALGLDSLGFWENDGRYQVRNTVLASWIQTLRPTSDLRERELILTCFIAAPELVHAYFREKSMQMDPKLTNTWIGYASFLFEVVRLPIPLNLGNIDSDGYADLPPQPTIILDSILPRPLTQKVMTRCLNQSSDLISMFATRLLVLALEKLSRVQEQFSDATKTSASVQYWQQAGDGLLQTFARACPNVRDVIGVFRKIPDDEQHLLQREGVTRLLRLLHETTPTLALEENFDVSSTLISALSRSRQEDDKDDPAKQMQALEMEHLLVIAQYSAGMRWFHRQGGLEHSPAVTILEICVKEPKNLQLRNLVGKVLRENGILTSTLKDGDPSALEALLASFNANPTSTVLAFVDDCISRATKKPVKYLDDLDSTTGRAGDDSRIPSLLTGVLLEQAPFVTNKSAKEGAEIMQWMNSFLSYLSSTSDACAALNILRQQITSLDGWTVTADTTNKRSTLDVFITHDIGHSAKVNGATHANEAEKLPFLAPVLETDNHPELFRWQKKDLDIAFEDGDIDALILCLCSEYAEVRHQAYSHLRQLKGKLGSADLDDKEQIHLLIGELLETFEQSFMDANERLPYNVGTFATHALHIQMDPTHNMYPKLNHFLMKGPEWRVSKLPSYWLSATTLSLPSEDDGYWKEVQWVLSWLIDGLRTAKDMELLRRSGSFERVMALYASPTASDKLVKEKVLELIYRAALIDADTLTMRNGVLSWLDILRGPISSKLHEFIQSRCDRTRLKDWAGISM